MWLLIAYALLSVVIFAIRLYIDLSELCKKEDLQLEPQSSSQVSEAEIELQTATRRTDELDSKLIRPPHWQTIRRGTGSGNRDQG